ncbi:WD40 repeat-like protein [Serendipita vermifera]|nr:WD40 repeat-like protein [Serendipita vermifera]
MHSQENDEEFVHPDDVVEVILDDGVEGDHPMDEDDEDGAGEEVDENEENMEADEEIVLEDTSIQSFAQHGKSVFAVALHPSAPLAVSGGEDDLGYLWDTTNGEVVLKLDGHQDSVVAVAFSHDGKMVATGGMDGRVRVWKEKDSWKSWEFLTQLEGVDEVVWVKWHPLGPILLVGGQDSTVWMYQLPSGATMQVFSSHTEGVNVGTFIPSGKRLLTGDGAGSLIYWDPRTTTPLWKLSSADDRFGLTNGVISVAVNREGTLAVVGGAEGGVKIINLAKEKGEVVGGLEGHKEGDSVESVVFVDLGAGVGGAGKEVVVTGGTDGKICVWDLSTMRLRTEMKHNDAITSIVQHRSPSYVVTTASADRTLKTWDVRTGTLLKEHTGHRGQINSIDVGTGAGGKNVLVSAGDEGVCLVWDAE